MDDVCPVTVNIRIRPKKNKEKSILNVSKNENDVPFLVAGDKGFVFDQIFEDNVTQKELYDSAVNPLICKMLQGFSCIVLAYGQTGTGKTYTMIGDACDDNEHAGLVSRVINDLFIMTSNNDNSIQIEVSFVEIYNQKVFDLLGHNRSAQTVKNLKLDESIFKEVRTPEEAHELLQFGGRHRHVGETKLNAKSSRSHAVFVIKCTARKEESTIVSKIYLVDLGGSESVKRTGNEGVARLEGISINQSLLALRKVLIALSKNEKLVPYRDSILTSILHDSLTIRNYICLISCVSPDMEDYSETINTLRFAESTKQIKSKPEIETILNQFKQHNPGLIENISALIVPPVVPTPMKRKYNSTTCTPFVPSKRKLQQNKHYVESINKTPNAPDLSEKFDADLYSTFDSNNVSSSTLAEFNTVSYSPIVKKCTEAVEQKIEDCISHHLEKLKKRPSVYKSPLVKTPECNKGVNYTNEMMTVLVKTINENISRIIDSKLKMFREIMPQKKLFGSDLFNDENDYNSRSPSPKTVRRSARHAPRTSFLTDITNNENLHRNTRRNERQNLIDNSINYNSNSQSPPKTVRRSARLGCLLQPVLLHCKTDEPPNKNFIGNVETNNEDNNNCQSLVIKTRLNPICSSQELFSIKSDTDGNESVQRNVRRSQRLSVLKTNSPKDIFKIPTCKPVRAKKTKQNPAPKIIQEESFSSLSQHKANVLNVLNTGSELQLERLSTVGPKTAQQIYMYRLLHGKFESVDDLVKAPFWRGKQFDRFLMANYLKS